jgi:regulation of enolase protein 1 (concanavalin A-like superfamily)
MKKVNFMRFKPSFSTILLLLGLAIPISGFTQTPTQSITFCVDYSCVAQTSGFAAQQVSFQSVTITGFRNLARMGATDIWCGTFAFPVGEEIRYSFYYAAAAGVVGDESLTGSGTCFSQGAGGLKRTYTAVAGGPVTLTFAWGACSATPNCPPPPPPAAPTVAAPAPTCGQSNVISVYSDTYTNNIAGTNFNPNWGQSGFASATTIALSGNEMRYYPNMNYQGIALGSNQNVSSFQTLHLDIWSANCSSIDIFLVTVANGERAVRRSLTLNSWNSIVIPLSEYTAQGIPLTAIKEFKFVTVTPGSGANIYVDNIYFANSSCTTAPTTVNVTFCVDYTCVAQTPGFASQQIFFEGGPFNGFNNLTNTGNNIWCRTFALPAGEVRYNFYYAGASGAGGAENLTGIGACVSTGAGGLKRTYTVVAGSPATLTFAWESCSSTPVCPPPAVPTVAAPAPVCLQENVISLFSDAYANVPVSTWLTPWSSATGGNIVSVAGNNTRLYNNVNFLGIETTGANLINATEMANFNIDIWTPNMTTFRVKLVDFGANGNFGGGDDREGELAFTPVQSGWNRYVIPLASFQAVGLTTRANIAQFILSGIPVGQGTLYVDNIFFSRANCEVPCLPMVTCNNQTVTFNGQNSIQLVAAQLATASGNCGTPSLTLSPNGGVISCLQVGQVVPVTVTASYPGSTAATCTSNITVAGLPCGWSQNPNGVNCANGSSIAYNPGTGVWTATSTNCFYGSGFTTDQLAFAQRTMCGDGSITAQVTDISGTALGWAGVVMRETSAAGAKKAQLMTNLSSFSRREFRTTTGGAAIPQQFPSQSRYWLRLVRAGNQFSMYVSANGLAWYFIGAQNVPMNSCIQVGLVATNYQQTSTVTATFANVAFTGGNVPVLGGAGIEQRAESIEAPHGFEVYPNPTSGELNVNLAQYLGREVRVEVYSLTGQLLRFVEIEEVQTTLERLDLSAFQSGMYLVKVKSDGLPDATQRIVVTR